MHAIQLEFDGIAKEEGFRQLNHGMSSIVIHRLDPVSLNTGPTDFTDMTARTDRLLERANVPRGAPLVIQAYCTGTSLALTVASRLVQLGHEIRFVQLFNPEAVTPEHVVATYCELADRLGTPPSASRQLTGAVLARGASPQEKLLKLRSGLIEAGAAFALSLGVPEPDAASFSLELIDRYCAWLNFLFSSLGASYERAGTVRVYHTRDCPSIEELRSAATELQVRRFDEVSHPMDHPALLSAALSDLCLDDTGVAGETRPGWQERAWSIVQPGEGSD
jgi:hypothetical protein